MLGSSVHPNNDLFAPCGERECMQLGFDLWQISIATILMPQMHFAQPHQCNPVHLIHACANTIKKKMVLTCEYAHSCAGNPVLARPALGSSQLRPHQIHLDRRSS